MIHQKFDMQMNRLFVNVIMQLDSLLVDIRLKSKVENQMVLLKLGICFSDSVQSKNIPLSPTITTGEIQGSISLALNPSPCSFVSTSLITSMRNNTIKIIFSVRIRKDRVLF
jgi:hypothetical protein